MADKSEKKQTAQVGKTGKVAKTAKKAKKPNVFKRLISYLRECKGEIKKITWTNPKTATKNFLIVLAVIVVAGLLIFALDRGLYALLGLVMATSST